MVQNQIGFYFTYVAPNGLEFLLVHGSDEKPSWGLFDTDSRPMLFVTDEEFYAYIDKFTSDFSPLIGLDTNLVPVYSFSENSESSPSNVL